MSRPVLRIARGALAAALLAAPAIAQTYSGQVVQIQERVRTENGGEEQQVKVRTREGAELQFRLGAAGSCAGCVQVGDQVRLRAAGTNAAGEPIQARRMENERTQSSYTFRTRSGAPMETRVRSHGPGTSPGGAEGASSRARAGDRDQIRDRDRTHAPGTGGGGAGARHGGGGGRG